MKTTRLHPAMWLTVGLWLVAILVDTGILAVQLSATAAGPPEREPQTELQTKPGLAHGPVSKAGPPGDVRLKAPRGAPPAPPVKWPGAGAGFVRPV